MIIHMDTHAAMHEQWSQALQDSGLGSRVEGRRPTPISSMDELEVRFVTEQIVVPHLDEDDEEGVGAAYDAVGAAAAILHPLGKLIGLGVECNTTDEVKQRLGVADLKTRDEDALLGPAMRPIVAAMLADERDLQRVDEFNVRFANLCDWAKAHRARFGDHPRTELKIALAEIFGLVGEDVDRYCEIVCQESQEPGDDMVANLTEIFQDARALALELLAFRPKGYSDAYVACVAASDYCLDEEAGVSEANLYLHDEQLHHELVNDLLARKDQTQAWLRPEPDEWPAPRPEGSVKRLMHSAHFYVLSNYKYAGRTSKGTQIGMWLRITASDETQAQLIEDLSEYHLM